VCNLCSGQYRESRLAGSDDPVRRVRHAIDQRENSGEIDVCTGLSAAMSVQMCLGFPLLNKKKKAVIFLRMIDLETGTARLLKRQFCLLSKQLPDFLEMGSVPDRQQNIVVDH